MTEGGFDVDSKREAVRWAFVFLVVVLLVILIAYARGDEHHHGDDIGALRGSAALVS